VRVGLVVFLVVGALVSRAFAQPAPVGEDRGYIGRDVETLEIDDCRQNDPALTPDQLRQRASEHYQRGETLYLQGDYEGAVGELVSAYCTLPNYNLLKNIGQAYERSLEYEKAIGYFEKYVSQIPADAKPPNACAPDPKEDKGIMDRRIAVLKRLQGHVYVETSPPGARIMIGNETGTKANSSSGKVFDLLYGRYQMTVELNGYEPYSQTIAVKIGKPYTYFVQLVPQRGTLAVLASPPDARIFIGDRMVSVGRFEESLPSGSYNITVESPGFLPTTRTVEVLPSQVRRELVELAPVPATGRRQLIIANTLGGGFAAGAMLYAFQNASVVGVGSVLGGAAGLVGSYFQLPRDLSLGTSNLTITSGLTGGIGGTLAASLFTGEQEIVQPIAGASALVGAGLGYYVGQRYKVRVGDAALFNSAVLWGTTAGGLFALSFDPPRAAGSGIVLSGLALGGISGVLLTNYFTISRTHALLVDIGGLIGIAGGLAIESLVYPQKTTSQSEAGRNQEHLANYALGGMFVGLIGAAVLTRDLDVPKLPVRPTFQTTTGSDGKQTSMYGIGGTW